MGGRFSVSVSSDQSLKNVSQLLCFQESYIHSLEENLEAIQKDMEELKARQTDVWRRVEREEDTRGHQRLAEVKVWLKNVDSIGRQVSYLLSNRATEPDRLSLSGLCSKNLRLNYSYGERVSLILKKVNDLKSKGDFRVVTEPATATKKEERPFSSRMTIVDRETILKRALNRLVGGGPGIMGLYGVGGVGKSTILRELNRKISARFEFVIWVSVSKHFRVEKIQEEIGKKLGFHGEEWNRKEESQKATDIHNSMKKKRFVLLLDDAWTKVDLTKIGVPFPTRENKCKIAFTARSREVCVQMGVDDPIEVPCLAENDAWDLFEMKVGEDTIGSRSGIPELASKAAETCHGLPLALNVLGEIMSMKTTVQEWNDAIDVLTSYATEFAGTEDETLLPILKYGYDNLRVGRFKSCFQYCALFPPGFTVSKEDLIECWEGEGFMGGYDRGHEIINKLVHACLLMEDDKDNKFVRMHDVVRDMALWIASDFGKQKERCIVQAGVGLVEVPLVKDWSSVRRMSLMDNEIEEISDSQECPQLTTLFLQENRNLKRISGEFFRSMPRLAVLNMSSNQLTELPKEISGLLSLQYLNLSRTEIERLPDGLGRLKRLKHINLEMTKRLKSVNGISDVSSLEVLRLLNSNVSLDATSIVEELQRLEQLECLNIDISSSSAVEQLFTARVLADCIEEVCIRDIQEEAYKTLVLPAMERLSKLMIMSCDIWEIEIGRTSWDIILTRARLRNLSSVVINACNGLKDLTWLLFVPNLTHLKLESLEKVEEVISEEKAASSPSDEQKVRGMNAPFQKLERLDLMDLPMLKRIYWSPLVFPCLKKIVVGKCPKLRKLPLNSESCVAGGEELVINYRDDQWFKRVRWEDKATKERFLPCCEKTSVPEGSETAQIRPRMMLGIKEIIRFEKGEDNSCQVNKDYKVIFSSKMVSRLGILPTPPIPYIRLVLNPSLMGKLLDSKAGKDSTLHFVCYLPSFSFRRYLLESFKKNHTLQRLQGIELRRRLETHSQNYQQTPRSQLLSSECLIATKPTWFCLLNLSSCVNCKMGDVFSKASEFVFKQVCSCFCVEVNHICRLDKNLEALKKAMGRLQARRMMSGICIKVSLREEVFSMLEDVKELIDRKITGDFNAVSAPPTRDVVEERDLHGIIVGQETVLEKAWNHLMDDGTQIMGLYGMGGVGKTTLLEQINNKFKVANDDGFEKVIWVVVSSNLG
ncbi:unnamed protein product [Microthlaspi erraticum]|uniref:NB-ARC domain-containing protein n=1 Tax=Microthlaspi erraticum TaxID=1685480 RepID=A0A6D2IVU1_9BRAS|nr:unnamed protein product [Microthlaspi erraticum]